MPMWIVKVCDPDGHRDRDELYGIFDVQAHASEWARENVPPHITWFTHHLRTLNMYCRADWEARLPDFLTEIKATRSILPP